MYTLKITIKNSSRMYHIGNQHRPMKALYWGPTFHMKFHQTTFSFTMGTDSCLFSGVPEEIINWFGLRGHAVYDLHAAK